MILQVIKFLSKKINSITIAAFLVAFSSLLSRLLGVLRDRVLAGSFGAGDMLDVYYAAFRVPDLVFNLFVLGAMSAGFIPIFTRLTNNKLDFNYSSAWRLVNNLLNILIAVLVFISIIGIIFAPYLVAIISPGFSPEKQIMTVNLTRLMFLSPVFLGISSIFSGILQSFKRFFIYSVAPIFYNLGIIFGALYLTPFYGVYGLAVGVIFGAFIHMIIQLPAVLDLGYKYSFLVDLKDINLIKIGKMMIPRTLSLGVSQVNLLVITIIASTLSSGALTIFNFANNLQFFPIGIFGVSFAIAAFPSLSALAEKNEKLIDNFSKVFRKILFFIVPSTVLFLTLRAQIVRIILGTGNFDWEDTILTMDSLGFFSLSLFAQASLPLLVRMFYAKQDSRTPFYISLFSVLVGVVLSLYLPKVITCGYTINSLGETYYNCSSLGVRGLALSFSISSIINFVLLWITLRLRLGGLDEMIILKSASIFSLSGIACGLAIQGTKSVVWSFVDMTKFWGVFFQGAIAASFGILVYLAFCALFKNEELLSLTKVVKSLFKRRKFDLEVKEPQNTDE